MSMVTYPLNNIEYTAEDAELFHSTRTSGVYATDSFDYSVTGSDNSIVIGTGIAWIKNRQFSGKVVAQKEPMSLDMGLPDPTYPRIDAVVIQFNSNKNATEIVVKNGAASSFPIAPEVVRTESLYELHLYHVRREAGSLSISAPNITDLRNNNAYCGLMSDSITQAVDSTLSKNGVAADAAAVGEGLKAVKPVSQGGTGATYPAKARQQLKTPFSTSLYVVKNASFIIEGDNNHSREIPVKVILCHKSGYMCEIIFMVNCQTGVPVGTNFIRWGNLKVTSFLYETTGNQTHYTISVDKSGAYTFGSLTFNNTYSVKTPTGYTDEYVFNMNAYLTFTDLTEGTTLTEATLV